jgi:GNAT superfamily N-acetyltransferase
MLKIIPFKNNHQSEINAMITEIAQEFELPISNKKKSSSQPLDNYWVAFNQTEVIGTIGVIKMDTNYAILKNMFVKKEFRGATFGISQMLLEKVYDWCLTENINSIYLGTMNQFKAAQKFYEKNEFQKIMDNELPLSFNANPIDTVFYKKILVIPFKFKQMITYQIEKNLSVEEFIDVLNKSTLGARRPVNELERIRKMLEHGNLIVTARANNKLIGVARSLTDFLYCTYLSDLAVDEAYQKQGIGKELIRLTKLETPQAKLILLSAPKAVEYYPKIGMKQWEQCYVLDDVEELKS